MKNLLEALEKAQIKIDSLRNELRDANKHASAENPVAGMIINDLLAQQAAMELKLNQLVGLLKESEN